MAVGEDANKTPGQIERDSDYGYIPICMNVANVNNSGHIQDQKAVDQVPL